MQHRNSITFEELNAALEYAPDIGGSCLVWKKDVSHAVKKGAPAGCLKHGYWTIRLRGRDYLAHRLVWLLHHSNWDISSLDIIDHIQKVSAGNHLENLRVAPNGYADNAQNRSKQKNNTSGVTGVSWNKRAGKWIAVITTNRKQKYLGYFATIEEAHSAYLAAKKEMHVFHAP